MAPKINRRKTVQGMAAAGAAVTLAPVLSGCADPLLDGLPDLPEGLPENTYSGPKGSASMFEHGVASGDPTATAVILWTRVSPGSDAAVDVYYEMALDQAFEHRVAAGTVSTDASRDYTVKVDVTDLKWGRNYYYRFSAQGVDSVVGRTRLAPAAGDTTDHIRFGVCSCSNLPYGWFHGYRHMATENDLDAVLHLGDYIYEYGKNEYGDLRDPIPEHEIVSLADYRARYAQYRREPELQELHRQNPFIVVWDDHETADNSYKDGAVNHNTDDEDPDDRRDEGAWKARVTAARQAYMEWLPIRDPGTVIYRSFRYGDLVDLVMLDTRLVGREKQLNDELEFDLQEAIEADLDLLGPEQEAWLDGQIKNSTARWLILGQQVMMAHWRLGEAWVNSDQWQGYLHSRNHVISKIQEHKQGATVVLTGDIHSSWANEVQDEVGGSNVAVEFVTPGITSPGLAGAADAFVKSNEHIKYGDLKHKGYLLLDITKDTVQSDWYHLDGVKEDQGDIELATSWYANYGTPTLAEASAPATEGMVTDLAGVVSED